MVVLEDVVDDSASWAEDDAGEESDSSSTSSTSSLSSETAFDPSTETLKERFLALKDIIPPSTRLTLNETFIRTRDWVKWTGNKVGGTAWVVTTTALLVGLPLVLSIEGEGALVAQEKEYLGQQAGANAAYGAGGSNTQAPATGLVPPGF